MQTSLPPWFTPRAFEDQPLRQQLQPQTADIYAILPIQKPRVSTMASSTTAILSLPPELILSIGDYLPPDCILALKLTHRDFDYMLPPPPMRKHREGAECARLFSLSHLSRDSSRRRCILCKAIQDLRFFDATGTPAEVPASIVQAAQRIEHIPYPQGLCWKEAGRFLKIIRTGPGGRSGWTSQEDTVCMHCGSVQGWNKCDCKCGTCSRQLVRTYTHYLN